MASLPRVPITATCRFCGATDHATRRAELAVDACVNATTGDAGLIDRALDAVTQVALDLKQHHLRGGRLPQRHLAELIQTSNGSLSRASHGVRPLPPELRRRLIAVIQDPAH